MKLLLFLLIATLVENSLQETCPWRRFRGLGQVCFTEATKEDTPVDYLIEKIHQKDTTALNDFGCFVEQIKCAENNKYRSISGYCNNLAKPDEGTPFSMYERIHANAYEDGLSEPRTKSVVSGYDLANPRRISVTVNTRPKGHGDGKTGVHSQMFPIFGQFMVHDNSYTPLVPGVEECRECDNQHEECMTIAYIRGDNTLNKQTCDGCQEFTRSADGNYHDTSASAVREQMNLVTGYLDLSQVYGSDTTTANYLRDIAGGKGMLKTDGNFLPRVDNNDPSCSPVANESCFAAGDNRVSQNTGLTAIHTLFVAEHNRIAQFFNDKAPAWGAEAIFQETKRILTALYQHITYYEFLKIFLNDATLQKYNLNDETDGEFFTGYDSSLGMTTFNEFATAAFRVGHAIISYKTEYWIEGETSAKKVNHDQNWYDVTKIMDPTAPPMSFVSGMLRQKAQYRNKQANIIMHEKLLALKSFNIPPADIISLNIQRGRDHGMPSYADMRKHYGLSELNTFDDLVSNGIIDPVEDPDIMPALKEVYKDVKDIDLFEGILFENIAPKSTQFGYLGEVASEIIGEQFKRSKFGDRYFYSGDSSTNPGAFTAEQLKEIRRMSLASIICEHVEPAITWINHINSFLRAAGWNNISPCKDVMQFNLNLFLDPTQTPTASTIHESKVINNLNLTALLIREMDSRKLQPDNKAYHCDRLCRQEEGCEGWALIPKWNRCRMYKDIHANSPTFGDAPSNNLITTGILPTTETTYTPTLVQPSSITHTTKTLTNKKCGFEKVGNTDEGVEFEA